MSIDILKGFHLIYGDYPTCHYCHDLKKIDFVYQDEKYFCCERCLKAFKIAKDGAYWVMGQEDYMYICKLAKNAAKYDNGKLRWDLLPIRELEEIVKVYTFGSQKYGDNKWQGLENGKERYYAALLRHLAEYRKGNAIDDESGLLHIAQVAWNAIALLFIEKDRDYGKNT